MSYHLFLDDIRMPGDVTWIELPSAKYVVVRSYDEFCACITANGLPDHISFDNDLADLEKEGIDCAKWLVDEILDGHLKGRFTYTIHSRNPVAAEWIAQYLKEFFDFLDHFAKPESA